jgi:hypothetical protein
MSKGVWAFKKPSEILVWNKLNDSVLDLQQKYDDYQNTRDALERIEWSNTVSPMSITAPLLEVRTEIHRVINKIESLIRRGSAFEKHLVRRLKNRWEKHHGKSWEEREV